MKKTIMLSLVFLISSMFTSNVLAQETSHIAKLRIYSSVTGDFLDAADLIEIKKNALGTLSDLNLDTASVKEIEIALGSDIVVYHYLTKYQSFFLRKTGKYIQQALSSEDIREPIDLYTSIIEDIGVQISRIDSEINFFDGAQGQLSWEKEEKCLIEIRSLYQEMLLSYTKKLEALVKSNNG